VLCLRDFSPLPFPTEALTPSGSPKPSSHFNQS
jgi:hypothetical protein